MAPKNRPHFKSSRTKPIRLGIADKSPLIQAALKSLFNEDDRFDLLCVCSSGEQFLDLVESTEMEVAVIGWVLPPGDGRFILDQLRDRFDTPRIVVYTGSEGEKVPIQAMAHGSAGFVSKSEQPEVLLDAVADVAAGRMVFPYLDIRAVSNNPLSMLTRRELEILSSLAAGRTNKEIAANAGVSVNTVKFHIKNLFEKLNVNNRGQAIALYLQS